MKIAMLIAATVFAVSMFVYAIVEIQVAIHEQEQHKMLCQDLSWLPPAGEPAKWNK